MTDEEIIAEAKNAIEKWNNGTGNYGDYYVHVETGLTVIYKYNNNAETHAIWRVKFQENNIPVVTIGIHN